MLEDMKTFWDIGFERECESPDKKMITALLDVEFDHAYTPEYVKCEPNDESSCDDSPSCCTSVYPEDEPSQIGILINTKNHFMFDRKDYESAHFEPYPSAWKGPWVAKTIEDAKQMAIDFANGVS